MTPIGQADRGKVGTRAGRMVTTAKIRTVVGWEVHLLSKVFLIITKIVSQEHERADMTVPAAYGGKLNICFMRFGFRCVVSARTIEKIYIQR